MTVTLAPQPDRPDPAAGRGSPRFAGYAALFGQADSGGDVILPGAFRRSLEERRRNRQPLPLLWQHRHAQQIGWIEQVAEDRRGLRVIARLASDHGISAALLKQGEVTGLSFGYRARAFRPIVLPGGRPGRQLREVDIFEVSLVSAPMQPRARVHLVV